MKPLHFHVLAERFAIVRLHSGETIPGWVPGGTFYSVTRTQEELSIICEEKNAPHDAVTISRGWRCLGLRGPFAFTETGIAAEFTAVLARAQIAVLVVSTYDTDYLLVPADQLEAAIACLLAGGHRVAH